MLKKIIISLAIGAMACLEINSAEQERVNADKTRPANGLSFDICVYGGTSSGVIAAYTARLRGKTVLLIEPTHRLGGLTTGGLGVTDIGDEGIIQGRSLDFYRRIGKAYGSDEPVFLFEPSVALKVINDYVDEAGLEVLYGHRIVKASKRGSTIKSITVEDSDSGKKTGISAKVFLDCSYEGDLMALSGVSYTVGREPNSQYGETWNGVQMLDHHQFPDGVDPYIVEGDSDSGLLYGILPGKMGEKGTGDNHVQAYNLRLTLTDAPENMIEITRPENYDSTKYELLLRLIKKARYTRTGEVLAWHSVPNHKTDINNNNGFSTDMIGGSWDYPEASYSRREIIFRRHVDYTKGLLFFIGHDVRVPETMRSEMLRWGYPKDEYLESGNFTPQLYIRESRRMIGRMVMTEANCMLREVADDPVGWGAYNMDSHNCGRYVVNGMVKNEGNVEVRPAGIYNISYRALTPKEEEARNLLVPVCLSSSHIAYGSIRMEPVFMELGETAALAACQAIDHFDNCVQKVDSKEVMNQFKISLTIGAGASRL